MRCFLCRLPTAHQQILCPYCSTCLPWLKNSCECCATPLMHATDLKLCGLCVRSPPPFSQTLALFHYQPPINHWIYALKFHQHIHYARLLGRLIANSMSATMHSTTMARPELIIPVPLHPARLKQRGFNQALEIAQFTHQQLKIPIDTQSCQRCKNTMQQSQTTSQSIRRRNLKKAFVCTKKPADSVAILDDVMTTGFTATALALALKKSGVQRIQIWCAARTSSPIK